MEKKAKKFVALLAKKFTDAGNSDINQVEGLTSAISSLKEGRLKSELNWSCDKYQKLFEREIQGLKAERRRVDECPDNTSFVTRCCRMADRLEHLTVNSPALHEWVEAVKLKKGGNSVLDHLELQALCSLLCCREDYMSLVNVMFLILSSIQGPVERCLAEQDRTRGLRLQRELHTILTFFYIKHRNLKAKKDKGSGREKYEDVLASLLSLYVDLVLLASGFSDSPVQAGKELCSFVFLLLSPWPAHVVDVLIQSSLPCFPNASTILPLARKCLKSPPIKPDFKTYTKYMGCVRSIMSAFGKEVKDICEVAEAVKPPKSYLSWLREQREELLDNLPEDRKFKGRVLTRFLLHEADEVLMDGLLDILTEELPEARETTEQSVDDDVPKVMSSAEDTAIFEEMPLFFVDRKGKDDKGNQGAKNVEAGPKGSKEGSDYELEVIEVDLSGFDIQPVEDALLHLNEDSGMDDDSEGNDDEEEDDVRPLNTADNSDIVDDGADGNSDSAGDVDDEDTGTKADDSDEKEDHAGSLVHEDEEDVDNADRDSDGSDGEGDKAEAQSGDDENAEAQSGDDENAEAQSGDDENAEAQSGDDENAEAQSGDGENAEAQSGDGENAEAQSGDDENAEAQSSDDGNAISTGRQTRSQGQMKPSPERKYPVTTSGPFTRVRTRSMTSVESEDMDHSAKLRTVRISPSKKNNGKSSGESLIDSPCHMTRQRCHGNKSSLCRLCAEPHCGSTCGTVAVPSGEDIEHSSSKKSKQTLLKQDDKISSTRTITGRRRSLPASRGRLGAAPKMAQRRSLSVTKSKKYQTRSRSGV